MVGQTAYEYRILVDSSRAADADLSAAQYRWVKDTATGIAACTAVTDVPAGVLQNNPKQGESAEVMRLGISPVVAGGAIGANALVGTAADGRAAVKTPGTDTTNYVGGKSIQAATAAGQIISVAVDCMAPGRAA